MGRKVHLRLCRFCGVKRSYYAYPIGQKVDKCVYCVGAEKQRQVEIEARRADIIAGRVEIREREARRITDQCFYNLAKRN